ncbi:hypothetical protein [Paenibacillus xanthanilyticus]|uniref:Uncharacterized protein n=1 Tax=Paenibacillus xanthanilyticus TaxID=1783531 RepID=A0ABV8JVF3_9BACL
MKLMARCIMVAAMAWGLTAGGATTANAYKCVPPTDIEESYAKYDAIVLGYVKQVHSERNGQRVEFQVMQSFKGMEPGQITLIDDWSELLTNKPDETLYLLYLDSESGKWEHPICAPSEKADAAGEELTYLLSHQAPQAPVETVELNKGNTTLGLIWVIVASTGFIGSVVYLILLYRRPDL